MHSKSRLCSLLDTGAKGLDPGSLYPSDSDRAYHDDHLSLLSSILSCSYYTLVHGDSHHLLYVWRSRNAVGSLNHPRMGNGDDLPSARHSTKRQLDQEVTFLGYRSNRSSSVIIVENHRKWLVLISKVEPRSCKRPSRTIKMKINNEPILQEYLSGQKIFPFCWGGIEVEVSAIKPARDLQVKFF